MMFSRKLSYFVWRVSWEYKSERYIHDYKDKRRASRFEAFLIEKGVSVMKFKILNLVWVIENGTDLPNRW